jgi:hypothetical protein
MVFAKTSRVDAIGCDPAELGSRRHGYQSPFFVLYQDRHGTVRGC